MGDVSFSDGGGREGRGGGGGGVGGRGKKEGREGEGEGSGEGESVPPDVPLGGEVGDVHVVDTAPFDMGQVVCDECLVVRGVKLSIDDFRDAALLVRAC